MKQYSTDFRERAIALLGDQPLAQVARHLRVSEPTLRAWRHRAQSTGAVTATPRPGPPPRIGPADTPTLRQLVAIDPDATLADRCGQWTTHTGVAVSPATMSRTLDRLAITPKKRP